ncbi:MAG: hypothetical protein M0C28_33150 [Candidatus Moduliflexus flocculans]|nr:hypothetical protein [Candidatus Moduliflexus flocculans]
MPRLDPAGHRRHRPHPARDRRRRRHDPGPHGRFDRSHRGPEEIGTRHEPDPAALLLERVPQAPQEGGPHHLRPVLGDALDPPAHGLRPGHEHPVPHRLQRPRRDPDHGLRRTDLGHLRGPAQGPADLSLPGGRRLPQGAGSRRS